MGVPAFFRWLTDSCPQVIQISRALGSNPQSIENQSLDRSPEIDNLYLDMNGIIHPCSHPPSNMGIPQPKTEQDMFDNMKQ